MGRLDEEGPDALVRLPERSMISLIHYTQFRLTTTLIQHADGPGLDRDGRRGADVQRPAGSWEGYVQKYGLGTGIR